jgi:hypothetical protein
MKLGAWSKAGNFNIERDILKFGEAFQKGGWEVLRWNILQQLQKFNTNAKPFMAVIYKLML